MDVTPNQTNGQLLLSNYKSHDPFLWALLIRAYGNANPAVPEGTGLPATALDQLLDLGNGIQVCTVLQFCFITVLLFKVQYKDTQRQASRN